MYDLVGVLFVDCCCGCRCFLVACLDCLVVFVWLVVWCLWLYRWIFAFCWFAGWLICGCGFCLLGVDVLVCLCVTGVWVLVICYLLFVWLVFGC